MLILYKMKVLFWLRKSKLNARGKAPINCRITISGIRCKDFSTGLYVEPSNWDCKKQRSNDAALNARLRQIHSKLDHIFIDLDNSGQLPHPENLKEIFLDKKSLHLTMYQVCEKYLEHIEYEVGIGRLATRTLQRYRNFLQIIGRFLRHLHLSHLQAEQFTIERARQFQQFCSTTLNHGQNHCTRTVNNARIVLQWAVLNGLIKTNPLFQWKGRSIESKEIVYLSQEQLTKLLNFVPATGSLLKVKDLFLFQCFTGLDFGDLQSFVPGKHIRRDPDGRYWIIKHRQKNGSKAALPLFDEALNILARYYEPNLLGLDCRLPRISNQKYNARLKELAQACELPVYLTSHVGRKTFGMIALNAGYSIEAVSAMLGHRFVATTQKHYAKVLEKRIELEYRGSRLMVS